MNIRKAELKDKKDILEIVNLLYLDIANFVWNKDNFVEKQINNGEYFLAENFGKIIGIISFRKRQDKMHIETIAVAKDHQSNGVGTEFVNFAKKYTKENGLQILRACAFCQYNTADFYLKNGFNMNKKLGEYEGKKYYVFEMSGDRLLS